MSETAARTLAEPDYASLPKDCGCQGHEGRHWWHMDRLWRESNRRLLASGDFLGALGCAREEIARLREKRRHMEREIALYNTGGR